uniref:Uncharacterized protein n=1 Tax=Rhizophora mucronata TaxID=61149 RepID=A0A2P2MTS3_RHIMU
MVSRPRPDHVGEGTTLYYSYHAMCWHSLHCARWGHKA